MARAVVFDLDGTLVDTVPVVQAAYVETVRSLGGPEVDADDLLQRLYLGGTADLLEHYLKRSVTLDDLERFYATYEAVSAGAEPFEGVVDMLEELAAAGCGLGVYTGAPRRVTAFVLDRLGLSAKLGAVVCGDEVSRPKPEAEGLLTACGALGVTTTDSAYVGDTHFDLGCAKSAGALAIHAMWSANSSVDGDHLVARRPAEVVRLVLQGQVSGSDGSGVGGI